MTLTERFGLLARRIKRDWTTDSDVALLQRWSTGQEEDAGVAFAVEQARLHRDVVLWGWGMACTSVALLGGSLWPLIPPAIVFGALAQRRVLYLKPAAEVVAAAEPAKTAATVLHEIATHTVTDPADPEFSHTQMRGLAGAADVLQRTERALGFVGACYQEPSVWEWALLVPARPPLPERLRKPLQEARQHYGLPATP